MKEREYAAIVGKICQYFGKNINDSEQLRLWWDEVKHLNPASLNFIFSKITSTCEFMPANLPFFMKKFYREWLIMQPTKIEGPTLAGLSPAQRAAICAENVKRCRTLRARLAQGMDAKAAAGAGRKSVGGCSTD